MVSVPRSIGVQQQFNKIPVLGLVAEQAATAPSSPTNGQSYYDTTLNQFRVYENGGWVRATQTGVELLANKGVAGGYAGLDGSGNVPYANLPVGTGASTVAAGNDSRFTDSRTPTGTAGGSLAGTYPNPTIAAGAITDAEVATANKDGVTTKASMRTLGTGAQQAAAGNHGHALTDANITGILPIAQIPTGTTGTTVALGNDSRFSDSRTPTGAAGGGLTGTYPNPTIAANSVGASQVINGSLSEVAMAAANIDGIASKASMRTLGTGAQQALAGNTRLDQISAPAADVALNGHKITGLADPTANSDAATKGYVDGVVSGLDVKASVRVASTGNVSATYNATGGSVGRGQLTAAPNVLDGITLAAGDRILLKDQTTGAQNGIWVVTTVGTGATGVWDRATDFNADAEVTAGAFTFVEQGGTNGDSGWVLTTDNPITIGGTSGTSLAWSQFSGAGSIVAGVGLTKAGNTISAVGTANRVTVSGSGIDIASNYVGQTSITTLGTVATGTWNATTISIAKGGTGATTAPAARTALGATGKYSNNLASLTPGTELSITHNLGTTDVIAQFKNVATGYEEVLSWRTIDANTIGVTADIAYSASALRVTVIG